jgi:hypothetical protein
MKAATKFQTNIVAFTDNHLKAQGSQLAEMNKNHLAKLKKELDMAEKHFATRLDNAIEHAIQEVLNTADEAKDNINQQAEHMIQQIRDTPVKNLLPTGYLKPSKLFPNEDVTAFNRSLLSATTSQPMSTTTAEAHPAGSSPQEPPTDGRHEPFPVPYASTQNQRGYHSLPIVNLNDMLK